uniref:Uncharacterized protein n=1 Tax=Rhizophora mucronata TaxID=61149 RepID=A0A2P2R3W1_RHIMU
MNIKRNDMEKPLYQPQCTSHVCFKKAHLKHSIALHLKYFIICYIFLVLKTTVLVLQWLMIGQLLTLIWRIKQSDH